MAEPIRTNQVVILAKVEATYGTDPTPTPAANAILTTQPEVVPEADTIERAFVREDLDPQLPAIGAKQIRIRFDAEVKGDGSCDDPDVSTAAIQFTGAGLNDVTLHASSLYDGEKDSDVYEVEILTAATPDTYKVTRNGTILLTAQPMVATNVTLGNGIVVTFATTTGHTVGNKWTITSTTAATGLPEVDPLLRACGLKRTVVEESAPDASDGYVNYQVRDTAFESITIYCYLGGIYHEINGCYGTVRKTTTAGQYSTFSFDFLGLYVAPTDVAVPTTAAPDLTTVPPRAESIAFTWGAFSASNAVIEAIEIDLGITVSPSPDVNSPAGRKRTSITARNITGSFNPEAVLKATHDFWTQWENGTGVAVTYTLGTVAGNRVTCNMPNVGMSGLTYGERENIRTFEIPFRAAPTSGGGDALYWRFK